MDSIDWVLVLLYELSFILKCMSQNPCQVLEESPPGTRVCSVSAGINFSPNDISPGSSGSESRRYQLIDHRSIFALQLNGNEQILIVHSHLDREQLCPSTTETELERVGVNRNSYSLNGRMPKFCELRVMLAALADSNNPQQTQTGLSRGFYTLLVNVVDINDHTPTFLNPHIKLEVRENSPPHILTRFGRAVDLDIGENGKITYSLIIASTRAQKSNSESQLASLFNIDDLSDTETIALKSVRSFDREKEDSYLIHLIAKDNGTPQRLSGTMTISIQILEENEYAPEFTLSSYALQVSENQQENSHLIQLQASDKDSGSYVTYYFDSHASLDIRRHFRLFETGELTLTEKLDYERTRMYKIPVMAVDNGVPPKSSSSTVTLHVLDENDFRPIIEIYSIAANDQDRVNDLMVEENVDGIKLIAMVKVTDHDSGANGEVNCDLNYGENSPQWNFFLGPADASSGKYGQSVGDKRFPLLAKGVFDREQKSQFVLMLTCEDNGKPVSLKAKKSLTVRVRDQNDNGPSFQQHTAHASVPENAPIGTFLYRAHATDPDEGVNAVTMYNIQPETHFRIDVISGEVVSTTSYDRELNETVAFTITAYDKLNSNMNDSLRVILSVLDENDCTPRFMNNYTFHVKENQINAQLGKVEAQDCDSGKNAQLTYRFYITSGLDSPRGWQISPSGFLQLANHQALDRESKSIYHLAIMAFDHGNPSLTGTTTVTVLVDDEDDNSPHFIFPSPGNDTLTVPINLQEGDKIAQILASDLDEGENGRIIYEMSPSNTLLNHFSLNNYTGELCLAKAFSTKTDVLGGSSTLPVRLFLTASNVNPPYRRAHRTLMIHFTASGGNTAPADRSSSSEQMKDNGASDTSQPHTSISSMDSWISSKEVMLGFGIGLTLVLLCCFLVLVLFLWRTLCLQDHGLKTDEDGRTYSQQCNSSVGMPRRNRHPRHWFETFSPPWYKRRLTENSTTTLPSLTNYPLPTNSMRKLSTPSQQLSGKYPMEVTLMQKHEESPMETSVDVALLGFSKCDPRLTDQTGCNMNMVQNQLEACWTLGSQYKHGIGQCNTYKSTPLYAHLAGADPFMREDSHGANMAYTKLSLCNTPYGSQMDTPMKNRRFPLLDIYEPTLPHIQSPHHTFSFSNSLENPSVPELSNKSLHTDTQNMYSEYAANTNQGTPGESAFKEKRFSPQPEGLTVNHENSQKRATNSATPQIVKKPIQSSDVYITSTFV